MEATNVSNVLDASAFTDDEIIDDNAKLNYVNSVTAVKECSSEAINHHDERNNVNDCSPNDTKDKLEEENLCPQIIKGTDGNFQSASCASRSTNKNSKTDEAKDSATSAPSPALAFTIDFGDNKEVDAARYQNLFQRYNARHRRNLSTSKIEIKTKDSIASTIAPNFLQKQKAPSTHSEGYFSSEDDTKKKADRLSQKLKDLGLKTTGKSRGATKKLNTMSRSYTEKCMHVEPGDSPRSHRSHDEKIDSAENCRENLSLELNNHNMHYSSTMNDLSGVLKSSNFSYEDRTNRVQYSPEKRYTKNIEYIETNERQDDVECTIVAQEKLTNVNNYPSDDEKSNDFVYTRVNESKMEMSSASFTADTSIDGAENMNIDIFNVSNADAGSDGTVSEAGTYTIHKDYTDEEKARMDIDKEFSVGVLTKHESEEIGVDRFKMPRTNSRDTDTWITEWATQVAEHNSLPPPVGGTTGRTPPMSPSKIPSPIYNRSQRLTRNRYEQSDSSLDMDTHLHIKERLVALPNQHNLIDSGGESDEDTSNSYVTPPHSSQRTPTHGSSLVRRGSLSEAMFKRVNANDSRSSLRKYVGNEITGKKDDSQLQSPSRASFASLRLKRNNSLDRKEYASDTAESNSSRKSSLKNYADENLKDTNSPITNRLRRSTGKLTNSPILGHKEVATKLINSPILDKTKKLIKTWAQGENVGYFTCTDNSPYMLRKSYSTSDYRDEVSLQISRREFSNIAGSVYQNNRILERNVNIERSSSNTSITGNRKLTRRGSFNNNDSDRLSSTKGKFNKAAAGSDSSSEGEAGQRINVSSSIPPISSSGIKLNRAFGIRRARLSCESDSTPNTTPEERRRKAQTDVDKSAPSSARQTNHHRGRTSSVGGSGTNDKDVFKKPETSKPRGPSISRTDTGRFSMRTTKISHASPNTRPNQKSSKDHKKSTRSNSTLTSKEVEFQNWKRRKSYDPMKAAAEGKKKIDGPKKHHSIENGSTSRDNSVLRSASFHGTRGTLSLADDWSDNEPPEYTREHVQAPPPCSPQLGSDSDLETSSYLRTTRNVMSAMSARINVYNPGLVDSGGESDEDTSHSFRQGKNKMAREPSDTESSDEPRATMQSPITNTKYNRAFSLRRGRLEARETKPISVATTKPKTPLMPATNATNATNAKGKLETVPSISRTDSGRFSMRLSKNTANTSKPKSRDTKKPIAPNTREVEMQNWKRRKSYDPMKAAMEGKRKAGLVVKRNVDTNSSSSHVSRSQSFHGPSTLGISEWSDDDISASADEAPIY